MDRNKELLDFLDRSPVNFWAVENMRQELEAHGALRLSEGEHWKLQPGKEYYVTRNGSALIAFRIPEGEISGFQIMASHCDSPTFRIKTNAEIVVEQNYLKLNVEKYGGALGESWFDIPLSVAGRVMVRSEDGASVESRLLCIDRDLLIIPRLAIHMNREANDGYKINVQKDMLPLFAQAGDDAKGSFQKLIAEECGVAPERILETELYLYNRVKGTCFGSSGEFIASGRLDDLQCAFASLKGFLSAKGGSGIAVHCVYDNEEVGSGTKQGAASTFLTDVLHRIVAALGRTEEDYHRFVRSGFMVSADNAHAVHPNYTEKADPTNRPYLNGGIVIKYSANQKYTTDAVSAAIFKELCRRADVPVQVFHNRSDMAGGSTLGNISSAQVPINTVDIGLPQLSMHSAYETAGAKDTGYLIRAAQTLFSAGIEMMGDGTYRITV